MNTLTHTKQISDRPQNVLALLARAVIFLLTYSKFHSESFDYLYKSISRSKQYSQTLPKSKEAASVLLRNYP